MTTRRASFQTFLWFDTLAVSGFMLLRSKCYSNVDSNGCNRARAARGCRCSRCSKPSRGSVKPVRVQDARCIRAKQEVDPEAPENYSDEVIASPAQGKDKVYYGTTRWRDRLLHEGGQQFEEKSENHEGKP